MSLVTVRRNLVDFVTVAVMAAVAVLIFLLYLYRRRSIERVLTDKGRYH